MSCLTNLLAFVTVTIMNFHVALCHNIRIYIYIHIHARDISHIKVKLLQM